MAIVEYRYQGLGHSPEKRDLEQLKIQQLILRNEQLQLRNQELSGKLVDYEQMKIRVIEANKGVITRWSQMIPGIAQELYELDSISAIENILVTKSQEFLSMLLYEAEQEHEMYVRTQKKRKYKFNW